MHIIPLTHPGIFGKMERPAPHASRVSYHQQPVRDEFVRFGGGPDQAVTETILELKEHLAKAFNLESVRDLPRQGILRIGVTPVNEDSFSDKDLAFEILVAESRYEFLKDRLPRSFQGYDVYACPVMDDNIPIT